MASTLTFNPETDRFDRSEADISERDKGERNLWRAVIAQAYEDATDPKKSLNCGVIESYEAAQWFRENSADFREACVLAELDPDDLRERVLAEIGEEHQGKKPIKRRKNAVVLTYHGETMTMNEWARELEITPQRIREKLNAGYTFEQFVDERFANAKRKQ